MMIKGRRNIGWNKLRPNEFTSFRFDYRIRSTQFKILDAAFGHWLNSDKLLILLRIRCELEELIPYVFQRYFLDGTEIKEGVFKRSSENVHKYEAPEAASYYTKRLIS